MFLQDGPHIANRVDQDTYRLNIARKVQLSRAAEARVYTLLIEETKIALARCQAEMARHQAEVELANVRAEEERLQLEYYQEMNEAAASNLFDAEMQIGVVRHQIWGKRAEQVKIGNEGKYCLFHFHKELIVTCTQETTLAEEE